MKGTLFRDEQVYALTDKHVIKLSHVRAIDIAEVEQQVIKVYMQGRRSPLLVTGFPAMELVWLLKPSALEGKRLRWHKHAWAVHNLLAHPIMQLLAFVGLYKWAMWVHDVTVPMPAK